MDDPDWFSPRWIQHWARFTNACRAETFPGFVERCLDAYPDGFLSELYEAYTRGCTHVGRQEYAARDLVRILQDANEVFDPARIVGTRERNVRGGTPFHQANSTYPPQLAREVVLAEQHVITRFGYERGCLEASR